MFLTPGSRGGRMRVITPAGFPSGLYTGGRLTLTSNTPVMTANATAQTTIFYTPYIDGLVSIYNGANFVTLPFSQTSVALDTTNVLSGKNYDLFIWDNAGTPTLGYGPAWTSNTARSAAITQSVGGVWTNSASITLRMSSTATQNIPANQATYVGTFSATANGQTGMNFTPAAASGGTNNILGLYNAQNQVPVTAYCLNSVASYTYGTKTWRQADASASMRISYIDGLATISPWAYYQCSIGLGAASSAGINFGVNLNSTTAAPISMGNGGGNGVLSTDCFSSLGIFLPVLGFNFLQAMEIAQTTTAATVSNNSSTQSINLIAGLTM